MSKRITLTNEDMELIVSALNNLTFIGNSLGLQQRAKQIIDKLDLPKEVK